MSFSQGRIPTIVTYKPTIDASADPVTYTPAGEFIDSLTDQISTYQHTIQAMGGYWMANFAISGDQSLVEDWLESGIGRHVKVYDHALNIMWEGFVNRVIGSVGSLSMVRGPLLDVANRTNLVYSTVDTSTNPPTVGIRARAGIVEDATSQGAYGVLETYLSSGGATPTEATEARNNYLAERKDPKTTQTVVLGRTAEPVMRVECLGYVHWFTKYVYNQTANSGTADLSTKLRNVIGAQLNTIIDTSYNDITTNTIPVKRYENDDKTAWDLLKSLVALGDTADDRYLFGVYADRMPVYEEAPTDIEYLLRLADPEQRVESAAGERVMPWNVLPGKWLMFSDLLIGRIQSTNLRLDPRAMFIESVNYTVPWGLTMLGGDTDKLSQKLAKLGLAGVGG